MSTFAPSKDRKQRTPLCERCCYGTIRKGCHLGVASDSGRTQHGRFFFMAQAGDVAHMRHATCLHYLLTWDVSLLWVYVNIIKEKEAGT